MAAPPIKPTDAHWRAFKLWIEGRIADLQLQLERIDLAEAEHNRTRGMIATYRELIQEVEPTVVPEPKPLNYHR